MRFIETLEELHAHYGVPGAASLRKEAPRITPEYRRTSFDRATATLFAELAVVNGGQYDLDAPLLVGVRNISDPRVRLLAPDGVAPDGTPLALIETYAPVMAMNVFIREPIPASVASK